MSLLPNNTFASPGNSLYGGPNAGLQTLSQTGNTVSLSPSGGSVDIASTTLVANTAQKTTALTYDTGFLATTVNGELLIHGRTEVGEPLNPANLSVTGTLEVGGAISDNSTSTGTASQFLSAGAGGEVVWATIPGGSGIVAVNAGTNISIPDPGIPVVSVNISSDLAMNGKNITSSGSLGITAPFLTTTVANDITISATSGILGLSAVANDLTLNAPAIKLTSGGQVRITTPSLTLPSIPNTSSTKMLYYNPTGGAVSYSDAPPPDGVQDIIAGSNIAVDVTIPTLPVVSVAITTDLDMNAKNIINGADIDLKGATPSLNFRDTTNAQKASLDYVELNDKLTMSGTSAVMESTGSGKGRLLLDANASEVELRSDDVALRMRQYDPTGAITQAEVAIAPSGNMSMTTIGGVGLTSVDNMTVTCGADLSLSSTNPTGIAQISTANTLVSLDEGTQTVNITAGNITMTAPTVSVYGTLDMSSNPINNTLTLNGLTIVYDANANIKLGDAFTGDSPAGNNAIAIGSGAGNTGGGTGQQETAIAIGQDSGIESQGIGAVALGANSGGSIQGAYGVGVGANAGQSGQGTKSVAVGYFSGQISQGVSCVSIGDSAGKTSQGAGAIAIGQNAGLLNQGANSIAVGKNAITSGGSFAGTTVINATGVAVNPAQASSLYVTPVRATPAVAATQKAMFYNTATNEVTTNAAVSYTVANAITLGTTNTVSYGQLLSGAGTAIPSIVGGASTVTATAGGSASQHLQISINGTIYKIALLNV